MLEKNKLGKKFTLWKRNALGRIRKYKQLYWFLIPVIAYYIIFKYLPIYGIQIAFKDFRMRAGIIGSEWVGIKHFLAFFNSYYFWRLLRNTVLISLYSLLLGFPIPIIFALMLNEVNKLRAKKIIQTITYAPHFISTVVIVGMLNIFLSPSIGIVNSFIKLFGGEAQYFMANQKWFRSIYILSGIWQNTGWSAIIYIAALAGIDMQLLEAATIDGATRFQKIIHINIPYILPTIVIMFILRIGNVMSVGFEKIFLMQNDVNISVSDVISTYVYTKGIKGADFDYAAAIGVFNSIVNILLLFTFNHISRKVTETSLW